MKANVALGLALLVSATSFAFDDEPDELNWDTFGGTVTGFTHFREYCKATPDFCKQLLAENPVGNAETIREAVQRWRAAKAAGGVSK